METILIVVACALLIVVEFLVCAALVAPKTVARTLRRLAPGKER
jgi:hypothetical protein